MKLTKTIIVLFICSFVFISCKKEAKNEANKETISLAISGMTCEIGCAKTIQSKLSKKEGVLDAAVVFKDSMATVSYDANTTSKKELIAFVDGIAGGELYKATETYKKSHQCEGKCEVNCKQKGEGKCDGKCKEKCKTKQETKTCKEDCKKECCVLKKAG